MSRNNSKNSQNSQTSFRGLQILSDDLRKNRDDLNLKTKKFINDLQETETEINVNLKMAKEKYKKRRDYWNNKVKALKEKKVEYKTLFEQLLEEKKSNQKKSKNSDRLVSIKQVERKIDNLERTIETENLDIAEENSIINAARNGISVVGAKLYLYGEDIETGKIYPVPPCWRCKKAIINAGIVWFRAWDMYVRIQGLQD